MESPRLDPQQLAAVFRQLAAGQQVLVTSRRYKPRTVEIKEVRASAHDPAIFYAYVGSGKVRPGHIEGGLIKFSSHDGSMEFQPTLQQPVSEVLALKIVVEVQS